MVPVLPSVRVSRTDALARTPRDPQHDAEPRAKLTPRGVGRVDVAAFGGDPELQEQFGEGEGTGLGVARLPSPAERNVAATRDLANRG
jgi:hypothetical protein